MFRGASGRRHAQAVFQIGLEKNSLERWKSDLGVMATMLLDAQVFSLLENPAVKSSDKVALINETLPDVSREAKNLAFLLVDKGRLPILPDIVEEYDAMMDAHSGIERVKIVTALPLSPEEKEKIKKDMEAFLIKKVILQEEVQAGIIGGLIIRIGDRLFDGSIRSELKTLEKELVGLRR